MRSYSTGTSPVSVLLVWTCGTVRPAPRVTSMWVASWMLVTHSDSPPRWYRPGTEKPADDVTSSRVSICPAVSVSCVTAPPARGPTRPKMVPGSPASARWPCVARVMVMGSYSATPPDTSISAPALLRSVMASTSVKARPDAVSST